MRLQSIDTLRGIAALGVLALHLRGGITYGHPLAEYGRMGVFLFFVISGFCIHLKSAHGHDIDFLAFWKRRWIRLYPAYLASIVLYLWWMKFNWFLVYDLAMHLLMLHNWDSRTTFSGNGVWWTLAVEEQLYLLYFVLLWMRRQWGWHVTLLVTLVSRFIVLGTSLWLHRKGIDLPFNESALSNWWLWALGAVAVEAFAGKIILPKIFFSIVAALAVLGANGVFYYIGTTNVGTYWSEASAAICPVFWGLGFFLLLNWAVKNEISLKSLSFVGLFSYSLYLTHEVVLKLLDLNVLLLVITSLIFAYVFFRLFERPFMRPTI
jgi:peptidoglycan/LPS O-acetylase OafA/YrhL